MAGIRIILIAAALSASFNQITVAQHGDFAPKVQLILDFLQRTGQACASPAIPGIRSFKACREAAAPTVLIIETDIPVRDEDGRIVDTCPAKLTATQVSGASAVKMEVSAKDCPPRTLQAGEFPQIFVGIILQLAQWVQTKENPA